jgi:hypothetical protein
LDDDAGMVKSCISSTRRRIDSFVFDKFRRARSPNHSGITAPADKQYIDTPLRFWTFIL